MGAKASFECVDSRSNLFGYILRGQRWLQLAKRQQREVGFSLLICNKVSLYLNGGDLLKETVQRAERTIPETTLCVLVTVEEVDIRARRGDFPRHW